MLLVKLGTIIINTLLHRSDRQWMSTIMNCCGFHNTIAVFLSRHIKSSINRGCALSLNKKIIFGFFFSSFVSSHRSPLHQGQLISQFLPDAENHEEMLRAHREGSVLPLVFPDARGPHPKAREATATQDPQSALSAEGSHPTIDCSGLLTRTCSSPGTTSSLCYSVCFRFNFDS